MSNSERKEVIGLSWEPKLHTLFAPSSSATTSASKLTHQRLSISTSAYLPNSELVDGLYVPPSDPKKLNKLLKKKVKDTTGKNWFDMPAPTITPELKKDLQLLKLVHDAVYTFVMYSPSHNLSPFGLVRVFMKLRSVIDPKRHYKKGDTKSKTLPKYFQVGTVIESASEYYSGRLSKKDRKPTIADELLSDVNHSQYRKRKIQEIEEENRPGGVDKWKIRGQQSRRRAKQRRR